MVSTYLRQSRALENWIFNTLSVRAHIWNTTYTHLHQWISLIQLHCSTSWTGYSDYGSLSPAGCLDPPEEVPYSLSQFNLTQRPLFFLHLHLSPSLMDIIRVGTVHDDYTMSSYNLYCIIYTLVKFLCFLYRKSICRVDVLLITSLECVSGNEIDMKSKYRS